MLHIRLFQVLAAQLKALRTAGSHLDWLGYLSSTGVYGDYGGDWVDERWVSLFKICCVSLWVSHRSQAEPDHFITKDSVLKYIDQ